MRKTSGQFALEMAHAQGALRGLETALRLGNVDAIREAIRGAEHAYAGALRAWEVAIAAELGVEGPRVSARAQSKKTA